MQDYGQRLQYSVYLCRLDADGAARMRERLITTLERNSGDQTVGDTREKCCHCSIDFQVAMCDS